MPVQGGATCLYEVTFGSADGLAAGDDIFVELWYPPSEDTDDPCQQVIDANTGKAVRTNCISADSREFNETATVCIGPYTPGELLLIVKQGSGQVAPRLLCFCEVSAFQPITLGSCEVDMMSLAAESRRGGKHSTLQFDDSGSTIGIGVRQVPIPSLRGLQLCICRAWNLPDVEVFGLTDARVIAEVRSEDDEVLARAESRCIPESLDPIWDELLELPGVEAWDLKTTTLILSIRDVDYIDHGITSQIGWMNMPLKQLIARPFWKTFIAMEDGSCRVDSAIPHWPSEISFAVVPSSLPRTWPHPKPSMKWTPSTYPKHIFMMTRGTRGDVQPFVALARGMAEQRGWLVTICTELRWKEFVKAKANVTRGRIRFRPSGGDTEKKMQARVSQWALSQKSEVMQMIILANSEAEFFNSSTVFLQTVMEMEQEPKPVDLIICGLTVTAVAAAMAEKLQKPVAAYILQPSCIPSTDKKWKAIRAIDYSGFSWIDWFERKFFTGHKSLQTLKGLTEKNPFTMYNIRDIRSWFDLPYQRDTWAYLEANNLPIVIPIRPGTFDRPSDWWDEVMMTDFIFLRDPPQPGQNAGSSMSVGEPLDSFLSIAKAAKAKVGLMTFSSMPVARRTMLKCAIAMVEGCEHNMRLIYVGKKQSDAVPQELEERAAALVNDGRFVEVERADFGKLFKSMDFFIIQGGLGTTVEALRMKKPVAVSGPLLLDQRFWGQVCFDHGVGPEPTETKRFKKMCVQFVNDALDPSDPKGYQAHAKAGNWGTEEEDGVKANVDAFAKILDDGLGYITSDF